MIKEKKRVSALLSLASYANVLTGSSRNHSFPTNVVGPGNFNDFAALVLTLGANSGSEITDVRGSI